LGVKWGLIEVLQQLQREKTSLVPLMDLIRGTGKKIFSSHWGYVYIKKIFESYLGAEVN
jgi:hypothetical protein